ncbi:hypothetical protein U1Q18_014403 [Sarracenia purpurea var. burkii]
MGQEFGRVLITTESMERIYDYCKLRVGIAMKLEFQRKNGLENPYPIHEYVKVDKSGEPELPCNAIDHSADLGGGEGPRGDLGKHMASGSPSCSEWSDNEAPLKFSSKRKKKKAIRGYGKGLNKFFLNKSKGKKVDKRKWGFVVCAVLALACYQWAGMMFYYYCMMV